VGYLIAVARREARRLKTQNPTDKIKKAASDPLRAAMRAQRPQTAGVGPCRHPNALPQSDEDNIMPARNKEDYETPKICPRGQNRGFRGCHHHETPQICPRRNPTKPVVNHETPQICPRQKTNDKTATRRVEINITF
jgi:hypothetical protein